MLSSPVRANHLLQMGPWTLISRASLAVTRDQSGGPGPHSMADLSDYEAAVNEFDDGGTGPPAKKARRANKDEACDCDICKATPVP